MNRFNKDNANEIVEDLYKELITNYQKEVFLEYNSKINNKINHLNLTRFFPEVVLEEFYKNSTFFDISVTDPDFIFEYKTEYWSDSILEEIDNSIDLVKMFINENLGGILSYNTQKRVEKKCKKVYCKSEAKGWFNKSSITYIDLSKLQSNRIEAEIARKIVTEKVHSSNLYSEDDQLNIKAFEQNMYFVPYKLDYEDISSNELSMDLVQ